MTNYLPESRSYEAGTILYSSTAHFAPSEVQAAVKLPVDSIEYGEYAATAQANENASSFSDRAELPPPQDSDMDPDTLSVLAQAFVTAFSAMNKGLVTESGDYTQMQQYDQIESQCVLRSSEEAIKKENAAEKQARQLAAYQKKMANEQKTFGWVMFGVGMALMAATMISGFFDLGASDAALPAEMELLNTGTSEMAEVGSDAVPLDSMSSTPADDSVDLTETNEEGVPRYMQATQEMRPPTSEIEDTAETTNKTTTRDLTKVETQTKNSARVWSVRIGKLLLKMGGSAGFASPMLMKGIANMKVAGQLNQLSETQATVGKALSTQQRNNMYFQFLQQLLQREGGVMQDEVSGASEVIDTYSSIMSAWRGITYGLANSV